MRKYDQTGDQKTIGKISKHEAKLGPKSQIDPKDIQNMNLETFAVNFSEKLRQKASKIESLLFYSAFEEPKRELLVFYNVICVPS